MPKRTRGYILTSKGAKKLQDAKREWESQHSAGCTEEKMRELTSPFKENGLDFGTIRKIFKGEERVDKKSIRCLFSAFNLQLEDDDLTCEPQACLPKLDRNFLGREEAIANLETPVSQGNESDLDALVEKVRSHPHHRDKIQDQCGSLRILDVEWLVGIDNIYIDVNVLEKLPSNRRLELSDFQHFNAARDHFDRLGLGRVREPQVPGLEAVTRYSKLMVLGKPGAGKTTFLKSLAVQCIQDDFQKERIPTFIELKVFAEDAKRKAEFGLLNYINQELCVCDVSEQQIEKLLHQGRFLILLDGLDEVKADVGDKVLTEVSDFSSKYFRNQFVITCRIAAQLANQRDSLEFTDVEVADFDEEQIEAFAKKWFVGVARNSQEKGLSKASQFIEKLQLPENIRIRELAVTPILLNLTCLVFQEKTAFPSKRAKLYEQGLDILLDRWDKSRRVKRDEAYRNLSLEDKKELLSQIAFITFERGDYFFEQDQIQQYIADYLRTLPDAQTEPKALRRDSQAVLKSLEAQHGLLIERSREIYSFSHLTFQEYFTAQKFVSSSVGAIHKLPLQQLNRHISEKRWREVFLLATEISRPADDLLWSIKQQIDALVKADDKLQQFLLWMYQKSLSVSTYHEPAAARFFYFSQVLHLERDLEHDLDYELDFGIGFVRALDLIRILATEVIYSPDLDSSFARGFVRKLKINDLDAVYTYATDTDGDVDFELAFNLAFNLTFDPKLKYSLQQLKNQLPNFDGEDEQGIEAEWWHANGQAWAEELRNLMLDYGHIRCNWQFSDHQKELLQKYYDANRLLVDCLNSGCEVTPEVRQEIEETLLLPKDEIERRNAEDNSTSDS